MTDLHYLSQPWQQTDSTPPERPENETKYLSVAQTEWLDRTLGDLPALLEDLEVAVTKQAKFPPSSSPQGDGTESPIPYSMPASNAEGHLRMAVWGSAALLWHRLTSGGTPTPFRDATEAAQWLQANLDKLALDPEGEQMLYGIAERNHQARQAIERPPSWEYLGQCPACRTDLHAQRGDQHVTCGKCEWAAETSQVIEEALINAQDQLLTDTELVGAIELGDTQVTRSHIQYWRRNGWLEVYNAARWRESTMNLQQVQVSRLGDVMEIAQKKLSAGGCNSGMTPLQWIIQV